MVNGEKNMLVENILKIKNSESYINYYKYHKGNILVLQKLQD